MSNNLSPEENIGKIFASWTFLEYEKHERGRVWYWVFSVITLSLLVYALYDLNFFFAVIILIFSLVIYFREIREPKDVKFSIGEVGILIDGQVFEYKELKSFWVIYEPPITKNLYFEAKSPFYPRISIPLMDNDPLEIRDFLLERLEEDLEQEDEPLSEQVGRALKI